MMKTITLLVGLFLSALPAAAQSRLYTNADLGTVTRTRTMTAEDLAGLKAREFVYVPHRPAQARVVIVRDTPRFAPFEPTRPLSDPWSMTTYLSRGHGRSGGRGHRSPPPSGPGVHLVYGR